MTVLLALAAAEGVARRRYPGLRYSAERQARPEDLFIRFDPHLGWSNVPGKQVRFRRYDFDTQVTINEDGYRGPRVPLDRTPGHARIVLLGDSFLFGHGVEGDETAAFLLGRLLPSTEVVNLGVNGYATDQELLLLQAKGLAYRPDAVGIFLCQNDVLDNGRSTAWGLYWKPRFVPRGDSLQLERETLPEEVPRGMRWRRELRRRFVLYDLLAQRWARFRVGQEERNAGSAGDPQENQGDGMRSTSNEPLQASALTRRLLGEMVRLCGERQIPVFLVVIPPFDRRTLEAILPDGAPLVVDLEPVLSGYREAHPDSAVGFRYDTHWNARGHRLVAEAIAESLRQTRWVTPGLVDPGN